MSRTTGQAGSTGTARFLRLRALAGVAAMVAATLPLTSGGAHADPASSPELVPFTGTWKITATWGAPSGGYHAAHQPAIDVAMPIGTPVHAAGAGTVTEAVVDRRHCDPRQYSNYVQGCIDAGYGGSGVRLRIAHSDGRTSVYLHLDSLAAGIVKGAGVTAGQRIASSGNTGISEGPHLHYAELNASGSPIDPGDWTACHGSSRNTYAGMQNRVNQSIRNDGYGCVGGGVGQGSFVLREGANEVYRIAGGAPVYVSTWDAFGGPQPTTTLPAAQFDALRAQPADNAIVRGSRSGEIYRMVGGAPIYQSSCEPGCDPHVNIDDAAIANAGAGGVWNHIARHPGDAATARAVETGRVYKSLGGAFVYLYTCDPGCGTPASVNQGTIDAIGGTGAFRFLRKHPADGATLRAVETGRIYKIAGGAPIYLNSCDAGCGLPVGLNQRAVDEGGLGALRTLPLDGTTLRAADTGRIYKVVGGTAFWLSTCDAGCGTPVTVMQAIIDSNGDGHLRPSPLDGTTVRSIPSGEHWRYANGCRTRVAAAPAQTITDDALDVAPACDAGGPTPGPTPSPTTNPTPAPTPAPTEPSTPAAPTLTLSPAVISAGQPTTVTYRGTPGSTLDILSRTQPATEFSRIGSVTLDSNGLGTSTHRPQKNTRITARTAGGQLSADAPIIAVRSVASFNANRVATRTYTFTGRVYPALTSRLVNIYRNGSLVAQARSDATGLYKVTRTLGAGTYTFQARTPNDQSNLGTTSPARQVTVQ